MERRSVTRRLDPAHGRFSTAESTEMAHRCPSSQADKGAGVNVPTRGVPRQSVIVTIEVFACSQKSNEQFNEF